MQKFQTTKPNTLQRIATRSKTPRRKLFDLHSWLGFQLALFMTLVVATGTFAVISDEIDWLIHPELRASEGDTRLGWGEIEEIVRGHVPDHVLTAISANEGNYFTYKASMVGTWAERYFLYIDPHTGEITGRTGTLTVQRFLRDLHRYLFLPSVIGLPLVTTMAVALLMSLYTGLKTARNWRTLATRIRVHKGLRVAMGDFHKFSGLWGIWFFIVILLTSFWYFSELMAAVAGERFEPERPGISAARTASLGSSVALAGAGALVDAAQNAIPGLQVTRIEFASSPRLAATVLGRHSDPLVRSRANRVFLDPVDASVIKAQRSGDIGWVAYLNEIADPLHFGSFGGLATKILWFTFGLSMLSLTLTGVWLTWTRIKSRSPTMVQWATIPLLVLVTLAGIPYVKSYTADQKFTDLVSVSGQTLAGIDVVLSLERKLSGEFSGRFRLLVKKTGERLNLSNAEIIPRGPFEGTRIALQPRIAGPTVALFGSLPESEISRAWSVDIVLEFVSSGPLTLNLELMPI